MILIKSTTYLESDYDVLYIKGVYFYKGNKKLIFRQTLAGLKKTAKIELQENRKEEEVERHFVIIAINGYLKKEN